MVVTAGAGFLLAVLWIDLMFDVQVLRVRDGDARAEGVLGSIVAYYRRVTTDARPLTHLIGAVMLVTSIALVLDLAYGSAPAGVRWASLLLGTAPVALALVRVLPNAVRLGGRADPPSVQLALARGILRDHVLCALGIAGLLALRLATR
jgi:hypothetical protein